MCNVLHGGVSNEVVTTDAVCAGEMAVVVCQPTVQVTEVTGGSSPALLLHRTARLEVCADTMS